MASESVAVSAGKRFMTDLLVSSLMADGGLEAALQAAIKAEIQEAEELKVQLLKKTILIAKAFLKA